MHPRSGSAVLWVQHDLDAGGLELGDRLLEVRHEEPSDRMGEVRVVRAGRSEHLDGGAHQGRQIIPREWVRRMHTPDKVAPFYGLLTWLNRDGGMYADASRASYFMFGAGGHTVWIDPDHDAVIVTRWMDGAHAKGFVSRVVKVLGA